MASPENDVGAGNDEAWGDAADAPAQGTSNTATDALETNEAPTAEVPVAPPKISFKVRTVDSTQGNEAAMIILDMVLAKMRKGRYGFVTNKGRLNVSVSRAKFFQVVVGDSAAVPASTANDKNKGNIQDDEADAALGTDAKDMEMQTATKPLSQLYEFYKAQGVVVNQNHEDLPQKAYVDLTEANAFAAEQLAKSALNPS